MVNHDTSNDAGPVKILFDRLVEHTATADFSTVSLPFDARQRSRLRIVVDAGPLAGVSVGIDLPRGTVMRSGVVLASAGGQQLRVDSAVEALLEVKAWDAHHLTVIAYHLGNRHVPVQIGPDWLLLQRDHVLRQMVEGLGGLAAERMAAFEPEGGAYGGGHHHSHDDQPAHGHAPRIHDLLETRATPAGRTKGAVHESTHES